MRAVAFATPACASSSICTDANDYVTSCVMRDDAVPRLSPRAVVSLQEEVLGLTWGEMEECAKAWGRLGRSLYDSARYALARLISDGIFFLWRGAVWDG